MTFCYICGTCGLQMETRTRKPEYEMFCDRCGSFNTRRDYKAEGVGIGAGVRVSRTGTESDMAKLFLPDNSEFAGPGDPDGTKGMREWHETHIPKEQTSRPRHLPGHIEKRSF